MPFDLPSYEHRSRILYDYAITGSVDGEDTAVPLLAGQTEDYPYLRETGQAKDRVDFTDQAGEQSLSAWWYRSQLSFHGGSQWPRELFLDDVREEAVFRRFADSCGVWPFQPGQVRLLKQAALVRSVTGKAFAETVSAGGFEGALVAHQSGADIVLTAVESGSAADVHTIVGETLHDMASDGGALHILTDAGTVRCVIGGAWDTQLAYRGTVTDGRIGYVKDRLIVANGSSLHEITDLNGSGQLPNAFYTNTVATARTVSIVEGPDMIYVSQLSGARSQILGITLDTQDTPPTLSAPVPVGELPTGEAITSMLVYLGSLLVIGSTRGVRIGLVQDGGSLAIGPLSLESDHYVSAVYALGDFVAASGAKHRELQSDGSIVERNGLYVLDLRTRDEANQFRWAWCNWYTRPGSTYDAQEVVGDICSLGQSEYVLWTVEGDGIYASTENFVPLGYLVTGKIRFNTTEDKTFSFVRAMNSVTPGFLSVEAAFEDGEWQPVAAWETSTIRGLEDVSPSTDPHLFMQLRFTLSRASASETPILTGYQVKALPANAVPRKVRVVALCFDKETDTNGNTVERSSFERLRAFEAMEHAGRVVLFQDLATGEDHYCTVESVQLVSQHISEARERGGREGLLLLTLRLLEG
jgi:hypothetical protein